jgi:hypothetical protein
MIVTMKRCLAALGIAAVAATTARAEQLGPKWQGWIGCWTPTAAGVSDFSEPSANAMFVCITPASSGADAVDVTTIDGGKVLSTQRIDASGAERPLEAKGCTGTQKAWWSADERRIYLRSASTCEGLKSSTSAILSLTEDGEWLDVRGVSSEGADNVRVARYRDAGIPSAAPAEIASALRERGQAAGTARIAAGAPIGTTAVIEATHAVDSAVVAAWILERDQKFSLDASALVQLADAGVPGAVTDAMVAVSNPNAFHFARAERGDVPVDSGVILTDARTRRRVSIMSVPYDPWSWGYLGYPGYGYGYGYPYGYGYNSYGYGGYGYGGYYGGYAPPIIVVTPGTSAGSRGKMVKGRGYTQTEGSPRSGTAHERPRSTSSPSPSASSPSPSASSSSGRSSSGSSSSGRTAKPRN